ncbi:MAG: ABC-F family ATP-binding cassette domain-containing protein, partial [Erysipelotrichaceae bacterium]|nr:ABC-F family ATP-binding cassette domain-containing protein [Erysipelotrichaceae bacterium]
GDVAPLGGDFLYGHQIQIGYFDQQLTEITSGKTVLEEIWDEYPDYTHTDIRKILGQFMFTADDVYTSCSVLSGGEKVRLALANLMLSKANLLVLDEPTNHLDIMGKEALESALLDYSGTVIFVSHDRYFIQKLATRILRIEGSKTQFYELNYNEYQDKLAGKTPTPANRQKEPEPEPVSEAKLQRANAKKAALLEKQIARAEEELEELRSKRFEPEYYHDYQKMQQLDDEIDDKHNQIAHMMEEWEQYAG